MFLNAVSTDSGCCSSWDSSHLQGLGVEAAMFLVEGPGTKGSSQIRSGLGRYQEAISRGSRYTKMVSTPPGPSSARIPGPWMSCRFASGGVLLCVVWPGKRWRMLTPLVSVALSQSDDCIPHDLCTSPV